MAKVGRSNPDRTISLEGRSAYVEVEYTSRVGETDELAFNLLEI